MALLPPGPIAGAEDYPQKTFLRGFRAFARLELDSNYQAWLYKISTNVPWPVLARQ